MSFLLNEVRFTLAKYGEVEILPDRRRQAGADVGVTCPSPTRSCDDAHGQMKLLKIISSGMQPAMLSENYKGSSTPTSPRSLTKAQLEGHVLLDLYHNPPVRRRTWKKARGRKRSSRRSRSRQWLMESVSQKTVKKAVEAPTTAQVAIIDGSELKPRFQAYHLPLSTSRHSASCDTDNLHGSRHVSGRRVSQMSGTRPRRGHSKLLYSIMNRRL